MNGYPNARTRRRRGMTLIECLIVSCLLTVLAVAQMRALTHLRTMHSLASEREDVVRAAHGIAEELRAGERAAPAVGEPVTLDLAGGAFTLTTEAAAGAGELQRVEVAGRRETPDGTIVVDLPVLLRAAPAGREVSHE